MLGLILIYFIGRWYYTLAESHNKNKWLFAVIGVVVYYVGIIVGGFSIGVAAVLFGFEHILELPDVVLGLIALPFGLIATWGLRAILKKSWENEVVPDDRLLDDALS